MTIEQQFEKYKDKKHLIGLLPKHAYVEIMLKGMALQEQMERTLTELDSATNARMPAKPPESVGGERKAKATAHTMPSRKIGAPGANTEAERRTA